MTRYVVLEPPKPDAGAVGASTAADALGHERAVFVRDGFSFWGLLFSVLWLLRYRLWLAAVVTFALSLGIACLGAIPGFGPAVPILEFLVALLVGLEGPTLRTEKLLRQGWTETAAFHADDLDEAEIIYYAGKMSCASTTSDPGPSAPGVPPRRISKPVHTDRFFDAARAR